jgi:hypothetical protein
MPSFAESAMAFCARPLCLRATPEYVFAYPAIHPFALLNKGLPAWRTLDGIRDVQRLFRIAAHLGAFRSDTAQARRRASWRTEVMKLAANAKGISRTAPQARPEWTPIRYGNLRRAVERQSASVVGGRGSACS